VWNHRFQLVAANRAFAVLIEGVAPHLLEPPVNVMRAVLHPEGMAGRVVNLLEVRAYLLSQIQRKHLLTGDEELSALYDEVAGYPVSAHSAAAGLDRPAAVVLPVRLRHDEGELAFFSITGTFDTPMDVTVAELSIESFFPADRATEAVLRAWAREWD
jgi:transcription regulator MmyB-like protein